MKFYEYEFLPSWTAGNIYSIVTTFLLDALRFPSAKGNWNAKIPAYTNVLHRPIAEGGQTLVLRVRLAPSFWGADTVWC